FHPVRDHSEGRKSAFIQGLIIAVVDENLRRSRVRPGRRKGHEPAMIALDDGIILDGRGFPHLRDFGIRTETKLRHESRQHTEEGRAIVEMVTDKIVEAVRAVWRPSAR